MPLPLPGGPKRMSFMVFEEQLRSGGLISFWFCTVFENRLFGI